MAALPRTAFYARGHETLTNKTQSVLNQQQPENPLSVLNRQLNNPLGSGRGKDAFLKSLSPSPIRTVAELDHPPLQKAKPFSSHPSNGDLTNTTNQKLQIVDIEQHNTNDVEVIKKKSSSSHSRTPVKPQENETSSVKNHHNLQIQQLPWTEAETEKIVQQLEFITEKVCEDRERFPKDAVSQHLRTLQALIQQDNQSNLHRGKKRELTKLSRDDPLLSRVSDSIRDLELVNLKKLSSLMQASLRSEDLLAGRDLLLLTGPTGSGKTTTLHFLAGTDFEEVEIEGFSHLEPMKCPDPAVAQYETSCCKYGVTRSLQTTQVIVDGKKYIVCDTPGLDTLDAIEEEIAFGIGATRAMQKARTVRPVVVLCKENLGHRFVNLDKTWGMVTRQFVLGPDTGLKPFNYIFTKFDPKHRTRLCQQFAHFKDDITNSSKGGKRGYAGRNSRNSDINSVEEEEVFKSFVEDIVDKTNPEANIVLPLVEKPQSLLRQLVRNSYPVSDPMNFFAPLATQSSLSSLQIQLDMKIHELSINLAREDYDRAIDDLEQLLVIAQLMPETESYANLAVQNALQHASLLFHSMNELFEKQEYPTAIHRIQALQRLAEIVPEAQECTKLGEELLWRSIVDSLESRNFGNSYAKLVQVGHLLKDFPKAQAGIQRGLEVKESKIRQAAAAGDCSEAVDLLMQVIELAEAFPDATLYVDNGYRVLQKEINRCIEEFRFEESKDQLSLLATLVPHIPQAGEDARNALRQLLNQIEKRVDENEYSITINLVQGLLELTDVFPGTTDCVNRGIQIIWTIFGQVLDDKHYIRAIGIVQVISGLVNISPKAYEYTKLSTEILGDRLLRAIQDGNISIAMKMLLHLTKLEGEFPDTLKSECVTRALKMISQNADKAVKSKKYTLIAELFHDLMQLELEVPEAGRCARNILGMIQREFERAIHRQNFGLAIELLQSFVDLEEDLAEVREFTKGGQDVFLQAVKDTFEMLEPLDSLKLIEMLLISEPHFFTAGECARHGLKRYRDIMEEKIDQHDYVAAAEMWNALYELSLQHPRAKKTVQAGFILLREVLAASLTEQNYKAATYIMQHFGKVERELPEADKCAKQSLTVIKNGILSSIDQAAYGTTVDILQTLVAGSKDFPDAFKLAQFGIKQLQRAVETKVLHKKDYRKAMDMIDKSIRLAQELPEALKCAQGGLNIILKATEVTIEQGDYGMAVDLLNQMHNLKTVLPEAHLSCEIGLQAAIKHLSWLRVAITSVVEQLGPKVPIDKFASIVKQLKNLIQSMLKSEPMRYLCIKLHQESLDELKDAEDLCSAELKKLTDTVVSEILNVEIDKNSTTSLLRMRSSLLSTLFRLKVMNEQLYQCPGGTLVTAAYDETFKDFYVLLDSVLQAAESRAQFLDPKSMDTFELQATFLDNIIVGFHKTDLDISDTELVKMEGLERRRTKMMHQFEDQIRSTKDELKNFRPPRFEDSMANTSFQYIQDLDLTTFMEPRRTLLALGKCPSLCQKMSNKPKATDFIVCVKKFDLTIVDLMERIIVFLESEHNEIKRTQTATEDLGLIEKMAAALVADIKKLNSDLAFVSKWSDEVEIKCRPHTLRAYRLKQSVAETLAKYGLAIEGDDIISDTGGGFLNPFQCFCARAAAD